MNEVEAFMASKTFYRCERLNANLTLAQCNANQKRVPNHYAGITTIFQCQDCAGLGKAVEMVERVKPAPVSKKRIKPANKVMTLDFSEHGELFKRMQAAECTTDDVIGLLYMLFDNELAVIKAGRKAA